MNAVGQQLYEPGPVNVVGTAIGENTLETVLAPYKLHCRYLQGATVEKNNSHTSLLKAHGKFAIGESCYIADTGHFNAVEFNICYNQLTYCLLAEAIDKRLLDVLQTWSIAEFRRRQLSDFLIVKFSSTFRSPLNARQLCGWVEINNATMRKGNVFMKTSCGFEDSSGATCHGEAVIVILQRWASARTSIAKTARSETAPPGEVDFMDYLRGSDPSLRQDVLVQFLRSQFAASLGFEPAQIGVRDNLLELGVDSLKAVEFKTLLEAKLGRQLSSSLLFDYPTLDALSGFLLQHTCPPQAQPISPSHVPELLGSLSPEQVAQQLVSELEDLKANQAE